MNTDRMDIVLLSLLLILPISALAARRLPLGDMLKMAVAWVTIFALLFVVVALRQGASSTGAALGGIFH